MKFVQNWWQKLFGLLALCFLTAIGITACDINTTPQSCSGVVNVNSCTSSNDIGIRATAGVQATIQARIDATATAVIKVQNTAAKDEGIVSISSIIIPSALFISIIALLFSFSQDATAPKVTLSITTILLIFMQVIMIRGV